MLFVVVIGTPWCLIADNIHISVQKRKFRVVWRQNTSVFMRKSTNLRDIVSQIAENGRLGSIIPLLYSFCPKVNYLLLYNATK